ncbi:hypothetical protein IBX65_08030 [Candidatus Aerophobetes bacterium]|nr:hypothetical protein [Candidatus Aerophobetes bacterium]
MQFIIRGKPFSIEKSDIVARMSGKQPDRVNKYYVSISGKDYPIKQVIEVVCGIPPIGFTSMDAYRVLEGLGFDVKVK